MRKWLVGLAMLGAPLMANDALAQTKGLTLERVFASPDLNGPQPRLAKLSPDGKFLTLLRNRADEKERFDLWAMDTRTGEWRMLVDSKKVGTGAALSEAEKMQRERARIGGSKGIVAYDWAPDGKSVLVPLEGEIYRAGLDGGIARLPARPGPKLNAEVSPAGGYVSWVQDQNLVVMGQAGGEPRAITDDGQGTVHWGEAEFVAQEEMARFKGYWWSPDDKYVAVERFDEAPVGIVTRAAIGAEGTQIFQQRYPKAGTPNVKVALYVMDPSGGHKVSVDLGTDADIYLARVDWSQDGKTLYVQRQNREQTVLDLLQVDPATGKSTLLFSEKARARSWVNLSKALTPLGDGSLLWWSERDGHGHLYRFAKGKFAQITRGDWEVTPDIVGVDEAKGRVFFLGNKDGVLERHLYSVDYRKGGAVTRLTEAGWWNEAVMDDSGTHAIVKRSNPNQPAQTYLADASGKRIAWVNENAVTAADHPYNAYLAAHRERSFGTIKAADGSVLHWEMITPKLEPGKKYPVFFQHYGGPHAQQVSKAWGGALQQYLVSRGYIWFQLDNRGSANRGVDFESQIWHAMGSVEVEDQVAGATYLKTLPYVDANKVVTYGWSYGGYMTLKLLEKAPGVFAAGVAGAPVTKWELYDTHYTERYMGDPNKVPEAYKASDNIGEAAKIADPMLLIHGMSDDNVVFENSTALAATLQRAEVPFEMMFYPGHTHKVGGPGISVHLWNTILDFLERKTGAKN
ncbi:DPP IV N-terminal domain-containing protein [Sphingomonas sp. CBMAI 2297]|uniref:S9 family peptidase n=1 Tax=Sphingomonas sp. CBMAI 2297 TaxID=2991720 RepID=UPI00245833A8|nr:S9 family peptidase [Sphingomonas sp. CBMAI 2297]MDH4743383.1 DPP IV N-terminal domain-containing protein [Sphingomonas sp. CBMAI 2297]